MADDLNMFKSAASTERGELTRNTILESALQLFRDKGFDATTMRDVATRAGVALGAAYYYFDSKDAIVMGFYERTGQCKGLARPRERDHPGKARLFRGGS